MTARLSTFRILPRKDDGANTVTLQAVVRDTMITSLTITPQDLYVGTLEQAMLLAENIAISSPIELLEMVAFRLWLWRQNLVNELQTLERTLSHDPVLEAKDKMSRDKDEWYRFLQHVSHLTVH